MRFGFRSAILQRYIASEFLRAFAAILGGLFIIYFSTRFASYLGQAAEGKIAPAHIFELLGLRMAESLRDLIPMSLYLGIYAAIIRMQRDSELVALRAAGAGHSLLLATAAKVGLISATVVAAMTLYAEPRVEQAIREIKDQTANEATIAGVRAGRFKEISGGKRIFYAEKISADEKLMQNAFVHVREGGDVGILRSDTAYVETDPKNGDRFAIFLDGTSYAGRPGALDYVITQFGKYALRIETRAPADLSNEVLYMSTRDLLRFEAAGFTAELQRRIALPIGACLLPLLATLIAATSNGANWHFGLLIAVAAYFTYSNLIGVIGTLTRKGALSPDFGFWLLQMAVVAVIAVWYLRQRYPQGWRRARRDHLINSRSD